VRISGSNAGYTKLRGIMKGMATHSIRHFPFTSPPVRHRVPSRFNWTLQTRIYEGPASLSVPTETEEGHPSTRRHIRSTVTIK
jgi:hypothetical protein